MKRGDPENAAQEEMFSATLEGRAGGPGQESRRVRRRRQPHPTRPGRRTPGRLKLTLLGIAVAGAALMPLYGDPRSTPLTHPLWARMLLRALDMSDAVRVSATASQVFATLSWRDSLFLPADRYIRADGVVDHEGSVTATEDVGEVAYAVAVVQVGDYRVRGRIAGKPDHPAALQLAHMGGAGVVEELTMYPAATSGWVSAGSAHLDPGAYALSMWLPPGTSLEFLEVAPPCVSPIEPPGGWLPKAITTTDEAAVTILKASRREEALPPADLPIEVTGERFHVDGSPETGEGGPGASGLEERWLRAGLRGVRAEVYVGTLHRVDLRRGAGWPELAGGRLPKGGHLLGRTSHSHMADGDDAGAAGGPSLLRRDAGCRRCRGTPASGAQEGHDQRLRRNGQGAGVRSGAGRSFQQREGARGDPVCS